MATKDLSQYDFKSVPSAENMKLGIVVAEWNPEVTFALADGAIETFKKHGTKEENIIIINKFSNGITYRSEKEHASKLLKDILMPNIVNHLIDLKYIKNLSSIND